MLGVALTTGMLAAFSQVNGDLVITSSCGSLPLVGCLAVSRLKLGGRVKHEVDIGCDFQTGSILGNVNQVVFHFSKSRAANFEILSPQNTKKVCGSSKHSESNACIRQLG